MIALVASPGCSQPAARGGAPACIGRLETPLTPPEWREIAAYIGDHRATAGPFDLVHASRSSGTDRAADAGTVAAYAEAGVTWWIEDINPWRFGWKREDAWAPEATELMVQRVRQGPPRA